MTAVRGEEAGAALTAAQSLTTCIWDAADEIERQRRLPPALVAALAEACGGSATSPAARAR